MADEVSKEQIGAIVTMLIAGKVPEADAQAFIDKYKNEPSIKQRRRAQHIDDSNLAFWKERFPEKGEEIHVFLKPCYGWKPELKPALPNLEKVAKKAIFWREIRGVRTFRISDADTLGDSLWASLARSLDASLGDSLWASLGNSLWASLWTSLGTSFGNSLWTSLWASLFFPAGFILAGKPEMAEKLIPLRDLWIAGNYPVGFDEEGYLLVLVA